MSIILHSNGILECRYILEIHRYKISWVSVKMMHSCMTNQLTRWAQPRRPTTPRTYSQIIPSDQFLPHFQQKIWLHMFQPPAHLIALLLHGWWRQETKRMMAYRQAQLELLHQRNLSRALLRGLAERSRRVRQRSILLRRDCTSKTRKLKEKLNEKVFLERKKGRNARGPALMHGLFCWYPP